MSRLSVTVMAHESRSNMVGGLVEDLGVDEDRVVWDQCNDRWDTGRRAMEHHDPEADWHMVIQDDALVCRDLIPGLEAALDHVPRETVVSPFMGTRRPAKQRMEQITGRARRTPNVSWIVLNTLNWGVAILVPTYTIPDMLAWCEGEDYPNYDKRVGRYYWRQLGWPTWHPWPNLVDHRRGPSISGHGESVAYEFIGRTRSALEPNWQGQVLEYNTPQQPRSDARASTTRRTSWTPPRPSRPIVK